MKILPNNIAVLENDQASRWIEEGGDLCHEPTVHADILPHIKYGDVVVDAGAFLGAHTAAYLWKVGEKGTVHAFEPNPLSFACLKHNCPTAVLHNQALGAFKCRAAGSDDVSNHGAHFIGIQPGGPIEVVELDSLKLPRLDFMKIDVEGWEYDVIAGALETIQRHRPILYVELNRGTLARQRRTPLQVVRLVQGCDYRIQFLEPKHSLRDAQIDVFFFPL